MRHLTGVAIALLLAGAGSSLVGASALVAALSVRQAVRAAPLPLHPWGAAAGLVALPIGVLCWLIADRRMRVLDEDRFAAWRLREI